MWGECAHLNLISLLIVTCAEVQAITVALRYTPFTFKTIASSG